MTRTAVSVRIIAGAPVALVDHAGAEGPRFVSSLLCHQLVADRETTLIVVRGPSDRKGLCAMSS